MKFTSSTVFQKQSPGKKRRATKQLQEIFAVSQRRACQVVSQPRSTQRYERTLKDDEAVLVDRMIELAKQCGRYGYRRLFYNQKVLGSIINVLNGCGDGKD